MTTAARPFIVLVDDEEDLREPTASYLDEHGLDVAEADGGRALDAVLAHRLPEVVVLDVNMPEENGFSIARRLREHHPTIGIVMLTARRDMVDRVVGLEIGADDYIMKPFEPRELLARINSVRRRLATAPTQAVDPAPPAHETEVEKPVEHHRDFWVPGQRGQVRIPVEAVEWIEAAKDYVLLHTAERRHMIRVTMAGLQEGLDPSQLMRVHRSAFVRLQAVREINSIGRHMVLIMRSGGSVRVGPQYREDVRSRLQS